MPQQPQAGETPLTPDGVGAHRHLPSWPEPQGLRRTRLLDLIRRPNRLTLVLAPAGSGKTTLLAQHAGAQPSAIWYRAGRLDSQPVHFVEGLLAAVGGRDVVAAGELVLGDDGGLSELIASLVRAAGERPVTLLIDDAHFLLGTPAEDLLDRLLAEGPRRLSVVLGSRRAPQLNLCRAEIGDVTVIDADDLRFRSWEVEALFHDHYGAPLPPDDVAALTRHTQGWAACLRLFHLSTRSRSLPDRRRAVGALTGGLRFARSYLARTVLDGVPADLRLFLSRTAVFEVLTARRCDTLLGTSNAQHLLEQLARLETLTTSDDGGRTFRYHEVLRRHLESALLDELGPDRTCAWYEDAARLLEALDAPGEALRAFLRAERWDEVGRLLRHDGSRVIAVDTGAPWHEMLPAELIDEDPWLSTAIARRLAAEGRLASAAGRYRHAESLFPDAGDRERVASERRLVELWTTGRPQPHLHWVDRLRAVVERPGSAAAASRADAVPGDRLAESVSLLLAGDVQGAAAALAGLHADAAADGGVLLSGRLLQLLLDSLRGADITMAADLLRADAERAGATWIGRQAGMLHAFVVGDATQLDRIAGQCAGVGDEWGELLCLGGAALRAVLDGRSRPDAGRTLMDRARLAGAGGLAAWAGGLDALAAARDGRPDAAARAAAAETFGRARGVWGISAVTGLTAVTGASAVTVPAVPSHPVDRPVELTAPPVRVSCFGGFAVEMDGRAVDWRAVRPRAATVLRLLAARTPRPVHRDELLALWPDLPSGQATHSLQVAVSALRSLLAPGTARGSFRMIQRTGQAYALLLPPGSTADVVEVEAALQAAERARHGRRRDEEVVALDAALSLYRGDLLPEEGCVDWVHVERDRWRLRIVSASRRLAELRLDAGELAAAIEAGRRGVSIDPYCDPLWRTLIAAYIGTGDAASAARARADYAEVLTELGLDPAR